MECVGLKKDGFDELIKSYCDTLNRNKDKLFEFYKDRTCDMSIVFPLKINEAATMEIHFTKYTYTDKIEKIELEEGEE